MRVTGAPLLLCAPVPVLAQAAVAHDEPSADALLDLSLEDLLTVESTSVAKKRQDVRDAAAAVTVITQTEIRNSAARTIPELLRMVPGVEVGELVNGKPAVAIRGFNSRASDSLLVMIDGRSIYVSTLAGVFWNLQTLPLDEIERIEVIRGPGAALWGANAVNGVVNIITRHSGDMLGVEGAARAGTRAQEASLSVGARADDTLTYRIYAAYARDHGLVDADGDYLTDAGRSLSGGLRLDWQPNMRDAFSVAAEANHVTVRAPTLYLAPDPLVTRYTPVTSEDDNSSASIVGRWVRSQSDTLDWSLQFAFDHLSYQEFGQLRLRWDQADADFGLHWQASAVHDINLGVGARLISDEVENTPTIDLNPAERTERWISGYIQDDISLVPDRLRLILGAKLEHNTFTGFEFQPNVRLFARPIPPLALWAAVSRAVRTPSRVERNARININVQQPNTEFNSGPIPVRLAIVGVPDRRATRLDAYELGARWDIARDWSLDVAGYYNEYDRLPGIAAGPIMPVFAPGVPFPVAVMGDGVLSAEVQAKTWGGEVALVGRPVPPVQLALTWSHFRYRVESDPATGAPHQLLVQLNGSPRNQLSLRASLDLPGDLSGSVMLRHVGSLKDGLVPAYTEADLRLTHPLAPGLDLSLIGQNLLHARHLEFVENGYPVAISYVPRTVSGEVRYRF